MIVGQGCQRQQGTPSAPMGAVQGLSLSLLSNLLIKNVITYLKFLLPIFLPNLSGDLRLSSSRHISIPRPTPI